ncbi:putative sodium- and chloride-dependent glycine transporter 2 [Apostichopus japonicus]|uniref:Putative sodium-and chloride-dependent glycine transporter 2 n=1 Tax=Stichopus japonicus TaxID=307972 RepID=A0A2G8LP89_STIJA|nr:putative sodium- and chloride-dependent glycine transporter 2 [Apostichopus japonicus]
MAEGGSSTALSFKGDENEERGNWGNKADFILSCLGYAVGLGNVWRFPYLAYESGGGNNEKVNQINQISITTLVLRLTSEMSFVRKPVCNVHGLNWSVSHPLHYDATICWFTAVLLGSQFWPVLQSRSYQGMEGTSYDERYPQRTVMIVCRHGVPREVGRSGGTTYMVRGVAYGMMVVSATVGVSYNIVITYCFPLQVLLMDNGTVFLENGTCVDPGILSEEERISWGVVTYSAGNYSLDNLTDPLAAERVRPSEEYWNFEIRREASSIGETGGIVWQLALCLAAVWIMVFVAQIKGIKSSGKVVYVTATFPYVVLLILLILGLTLPGHKEGIKFFISPDWDKVTDPQPPLRYFTRLVQPGVGLSLSHYNKFHNNCYSDSMFVAIANCATSILAGFVIFSIVGFMAHELNQEIDEVVDQGYGLAFIAYPEAVARLPGAPIWSTLFFLMLVTLGLDSQFVNVETVVTAIVDEYPEKLRPRKTLVLAVVCSVGFLVGLLCVTEAGPYWADLFDLYGASFNLLIFGFFECIALTWLYGVKRLRNDIRSMIGDGPVDFPLFHWWTLMWSAISPAVLLFVLIYNWTNWADPTHNGPYPGWARAIGWMITMTTLIWIPVFCIYEFLRARGTFYERWQAISNPGPDWGPAVQKFREDAWGIHLQHGTTMGGDLIRRSQNNSHHTDVEMVETKDMDNYENKTYEPTGDA